MAAFSSAAQLRRRPAPVNTSTRRARSDTCISSEIDIGRSSKPAPNIIPFTPGAGRCSQDDAYLAPGPNAEAHRPGERAQEGALGGGARVCAPEGADGADREDGGSGASAGED